MLEFVWATDETETWSANDIRDYSPEDTHLIRDDGRGVLFHSGDGDGALVIGTRRELIARFEAEIAKLRGLHDVVDGEVVTLSLPAGGLALPAA